MVHGLFGGAALHFASVHRLLLLAVFFFAVREGRGVAALHEPHGPNAFRRDRPERVLL